MSVTIRFDPNSLNIQAATIPDATPFNDGVMTKAQAAELAAFVAGAGYTTIESPPATPLPKRSILTFDGILLSAADGGGKTNVTAPGLLPLTGGILTGTIIENVNLSFSKEANHVINVIDSTTGGAAGGALAITSAAGAPGNVGNPGQLGGALSVTSGAGGAGSATQPGGTGADINITTGAGGAAAGAGGGGGGNLFLIGGSSAAADAAAAGVAGSFSIYSSGDGGAASATQAAGVGGDVFLGCIGPGFGGNGGAGSVGQIGGNGGNVTIQAGQAGDSGGFGAGANRGGFIIVFGGIGATADATGPGGKGGPIFIIGGLGGSGSATKASGPGGSTFITGGAPGLSGGGGTGVAGDVTIGTDGSGTNSVNLHLGYAGIKIGMFGAGSVVQPATAGTAGTWVVGVGAAVLQDSTTDGGLGGTKYNMSDIVKAMKQLGTIAP